MKSNISLTLITFIISIASTAQGRCGFDILHKKRMKEEPAYRKGIEEEKLWIKQYISTHQNELQNLPTVALYTIPVVVHVVHTGGAIGSIYNPTDAQIQNTITYLNQVYDGSYPGTEGVGDIQIQFTLAQLDPNCNSTTGINRADGSGIANYNAGGVNLATTLGTDEINVKNLIRWDPSKYYNIWVVNRIDGNDGTSGSFYAGYAYFPGAPAALDGTVMLATQMQPGRKTLPHEIGHALSIYHPFEGTGPPGPPCPANADCTVDGDEICDTDPITLPAAFACRTGNNSCTGTPYSINTEHNYMNYTNCATLFTADQKTRMLAAIVGPYRIGLTASWGSSPTYPLSPFNPPSAAGCTPITGAPGMGGNFAGLLRMSIAGRELTSGTAFQDGGYLDGATNCLSLTQLIRGNTYNFSATVLAANYEQLRFWIDYNNNGIFDNVTEQIYYNADVGPNGTGNITVNGSFTVPLTAAINTVLRIRLLDEVSIRYGGGFAITSACYNPQYGQAEDYPVYLLPETILPVKMEFFRIKNVNGSAFLSWKTTYENNADKFVIEKSIDGISFIAIGEIEAKGTATGNVYNYTDKDPGGSIFYYRLNQLDQDKKSKYSEVVMIRFSGALVNQWRVLNNPFNNFIELSMSESLKGEVLIRLIDMTGRLVHNQNVNAKLQRQIRIDLTGKNMERGIYLLQVRCGNEVFTEKLIKQ